MMMGVWVGALQIIIPKYDPEQVLAAIRDFRPTYFPAVPTVFVSLLEPSEGRASTASSSVRTFNSGGAPCPVEVIEEFERADRPAAERRLRPVGNLAGHALDAAARAAQAGHDRPAVPRHRHQDRRRRDRRRASCRSARPASCASAGPQVMKGYWNQPDESARVLRTRRRRPRSGSTPATSRAIDEDGYTSIVQRKKDMIIVDGFNVYPSEVEAVLYTHPAVRLAAVIGVPDAYHGEIVKACIALEAGRDGDRRRDRRALPRRACTEYKVPRQRRDPRHAADERGRQDPLPRAARRARRRGPKVMTPRRSARAR